MKLSYRVLVLLIASNNAVAAGFAINEQSGSSMGNANAGAAAIAENASTIFSNPAGMTYLPDSQLVVAAHAIQLSGQLQNNGSVAGLGKPLNGDGGDAGGWSLLPNLFYAKAISPDVRLGIGISAPFGLKTEYDSNWLGRFQAVKSELSTVNINPSIAFKVNDALSLGAGVSAMRTSATLTNAVNFLGFGEGFATVKGNDWGYGFNFGAIYQFTPDTRVGMSYRSKINQTLKGNVTFVTPAALPPAFTPANGPVSASTALPENISLSIFSKVNDQWDVMGDITWTHWSRFKELAIIRDTGALIAPATAENWSNTWRFSAGANYRYNDKLKLRTGVAYDQEAISDQFRTARIPGNDRKWISVGAEYKFTDNSTIDVAYTHLFIKDASINNIDSQPTLRNGRIAGDYEGYVNILSAQYTHNF